MKVEDSSLPRFEIAIELAHQNAKALGAPSSVICTSPDKSTVYTVDLSKHKPQR